MAVADTAKLLASLELQDKLTPGINKAIGSVGKLETSFGRIGAAAKRGIGNAVTNIQRLGLVAAAGLGAAIGTGLQDLATLESAVTSVDGAIRSMGETGQLTGQQVAGWANKIERNIGAAFDDKAITAASATLIRFGHLAPSNLQPAMVVMTDLAAKTGSVQSAATILAKALAAPESAAGKLTRAGVILTKQQQEEIKALVKSGETAKAQAVLLDALAQTTRGAAAATQGPYARALAVLRDTSEDARKALAEGFLPIIERVSTRLSTALADPKVLQGIRDFGKGLAGSLDSVITMAERLPWGSIADALRLGGAGAKAILDAFVKMPAWVQTAILTGWGLNKLTGGAVGDIIGELGKGLIKGVLGMNAGVVNINAAVVNGGLAGGAGAIAGTAEAGILAKLKSGLSIIGPVSIAVASIAALAYEVGQFMNTVGQAQTELGGQVEATKTQDFTATVANLKAVTDSLNSMNLIQRGIALTFGGGQITQDFADAANRIVAATLTSAEATKALPAVQAALDRAQYEGLTAAIGPLKDAIAKLKEEIAANRVLISQPDKAPVSLTATADDPRYATGVARLARMGERDDKLLPAFQAIFDRAWTHGKVATDTALQSTYLRNIQRGIEKQSISAAIAATSARMLAIAQAVGAASIVRAINAKQWGVYAGAQGSYTPSEPKPKAVATPPWSEHGGAGGLLAMAAAPTRFMAGEVGSEYVAILRNPRSGQLGSGSPINITINTGASIRDTVLKTASYGRHGTPRKIA